MKIYSSLLLLTIFTSSFGQLKDTKLVYPSGKIKQEQKFDKSCNCDRVTAYFESGKIRSKKTYLNHGHFNQQLDGEDIEYFENGTIQVYYFWKDGAPNGRIYSNFENGKLGYEKFFANKFKTGSWKFYNQEGLLLEEIIFVDNKTPWNSNEDYATVKFYFNRRLAYTEELIAGKKTNAKIIDPYSYEKWKALQPATGQKLFIENCGMCHSPDADLMGPMMKGVTDKRTIDWLNKMIRNGDALQKKGDQEAVELYKKWHNIQHPNFERLSDEEMEALIEYLKTLK